MIKPTGHHRMLGIALGEQSLLVAEVCTSASRRRVTRVSAFDYPAGATLREPQALGIALARHLKEYGFEAHAAVFGVPVKWVLSKRKTVPAADERIVAQTLRLQAEGEFSPELNDLVYDYSGPGPSGAVLLLALPGRYVEQIKTLAEAARLRVRAIMPSSAAVASAHPSQGAMVLLGVGGVEFVAQSGSHLGAMRYVGAASTAPALLAGELRRAAALVLSNGKPATDGQAQPGLTVWNDLGPDDQAIGAIGEAIGIPVRGGALSELGVEPSSSQKIGPGFFAPVALALAGLARGAAPVNFARSRLAAPVQRRIERRTALAIVAGIAIVLGLGSWYVSLHSQQAELDARTAALTARQPQRDAAEAEIHQIEFARHWHGEKPRFIACLCDLTLANSVPGRLYGTEFNLLDDPKRPGNLSGTLSGEALDRKDVLALQDRLNAAKGFSDVTVLRMESRDSGKGGPEVSFRIGFDYLPPK